MSYLACALAAIAAVIVWRSGAEKDAPKSNGKGASFNERYRVTAISRAPRRESLTADVKRARD